MRAHSGPVIGAAQGHAEKIYNGFEGGLYTKTLNDGLYHLFPTECMSDMKGEGVGGRDRARDSVLAVLPSMTAVPKMRMPGVLLCSS